MLSYNLLYFHSKVSYEPLSTLINICWSHDLSLRKVVSSYQCKMPLWSSGLLWGWARARQVKSERRWLIHCRAAGNVEPGVPLAVKVAPASGAVCYLNSSFPNKKTSPASYISPSHTCFPQWILSAKIWTLKSNSCFYVTCFQALELLDEVALRVYSEE